MVQSCSAINCTRRRNKGVKLKFHNFPKDSNLRQLWVHALRRAKYNPSKRASICEKHFTEKDYELNVYGNRVLKKGAIPSVFDFPSNLQRDIKERRVLKRNVESGDSSVAGAPALTKQKLNADWVPTINLDIENESNSERITVIIENDEASEKTISSEETELSEMKESIDPLTITKQDIIEIKTEIVPSDESENSFCNNQESEKVENVRNFVKDQKDLENICRGCLSNVGVITMNDAHVAGINVILMYEAVTKAKFNTTNVPARMCVTCLTLLFQTYQFFNMLQESFQVLEQIVTQLKYEKNHNDSKIEIAKIVLIQSVDQPQPLETLSKPVNDNNLLSTSLVAENQAKAKTLTKNGEKNSCTISSQKAPPVTKKASLKSSVDTKCPICDKYVKFVNAHLFSMHNLSLVEKRCLYCGYRSRNVNTLISHCKKGHDLIPSTSVDELVNNQASKDVICKTEPDQSENPLEVICPVCDQSVSFYMEHLELEHSVNWVKKKCHKCGFHSNVDDVLVEHVKVENGFSKKMCKKCDLSFTTMDQFRRHMDYSICQRKKLNTRRTVRLPKTYVTKNKTQFQYSCNTCENVGFNEYSEIDKHYREIHADQSECILCEEKFKNYWLTVTHMANEHGKLKCCKVCLITFYTNDQLREHYKSPEHNTLCTVCNESFSGRRALYNHRKYAHLRNSQTSKNYKCTECPKIFTERGNINRHIRTIHRNMRYLCDFCGKDYTRRLALENHIKVRHKGEVLEKKVANITKKFYVCEKCGFSTKVLNRWSIAVHKAKHKGHTAICRRCRESFETDDELEKHIEQEKHALFKCNQCPSEFIREETLTNHMKNHSNPNWRKDTVHQNRTRPDSFGKSRNRVAKGYTCEFCGRFCDTLQFLTNHRRVHTNERPFKCDICHKGFKTSVHRKTHSAIHLGIKKWTCKHCGKAFTYHSNMVMHEMIHTGEKPHKCPVCDKGFITASAMRKHMKMHLKMITKKNTRKIIDKSELPFEEIINEESRGAQDSSSSCDPNDDMDASD